MQNFVRRRSRRVVAAAMLAAIPSVSPAATFIWSGGDATVGYFAAGNNWAGNSPPPTSGADLIFGPTNAHNSAPFAETAYSVNSINFSTGAYAYSGNQQIEANLLTIGGGGIIDSAANLETISNPIMLGANQTWTVSGGNFNTTGSIILGTNALTAYVSSGAMAFNGALVAGASSTATVTKTGAGALNLGLSSTSSISGFSQTAGTTSLTAGTLGLTTTNTYALNLSGGAFNISGGAVLNTSAGSSISVLLNTGAAVLVTGAGSQLDTPTSNGNIYVGFGGAASLNVSSGGLVTCNTSYISRLGTSQLVVASGGTFNSSNTYFGSASSSIGNGLVTGAGSVLNASLLGLGGGNDGVGALTVSNGGTVNAGSTSFTLTSSSINISQGTLTTGSLTGTGSISLADPSGGTALTINGSLGTSTYSGTITGTGSLLKSGGSTQILSGNINTSGNVTVTGGLVSFNASGTSNVNALLIQGGAANVSNGTLKLTVSTSQYLVTAGTLTINNGATVDATALTSSNLNAVDGVSGTGITVTGSGSTYKGGQQLTLGLFNYGSLAVQNFGSVSNTYYLSIGQSLGSNGSLSVTSGGSVQCAVGILGQKTGGIALATVDGSGSNWTCTNSLYVGGSAGIGGSANATGTLIINNSGSVATPFTVFESNSATVNISGGTFTTGYLSSYNTGNGAINLQADPSSGTALTINDATAADVNTYSGTIRGAGSFQKSGGSTQILSGNINTSGTATVTAGTLVFNGSGNSNIGILSVTGGAANFSAGSVTLTRLNSILDIAGGSLNIVNANLSVGSSSIYAFVDGPAGTSMNVTGSNASFISGGPLEVGESLGNFGNLNVSLGAQVSAGSLYVAVGGAGVVSVSSGGIVNSPSAFVAYSGSAGASGVVTIAGSGSAWNVSGNLDIGSTGETGSLSINNSGGVYVSGVTNCGGNFVPINVSAGTFTTGLLSSNSTGNGVINLISDPTSGTALTLNASSGSSNYSGSISGAGSILKSGGSTQILSGLDTFTGAAQVTGGVLEFTTRNQFSSLVITGGTAQINGSGNILVVPTLAVTAGGTLDLTTDSADISASSLSVINALATKGFNNGLWTGTGLTSSSAAANTKHLTAIGVIQNNQGGPAIYIATHQFEGVTPGASDVLMKYTYYGDTNLDGKVDGSDYSRIDAAALADKTNPTAMTGWFNGDFNYDNLVNGSDYTLIDNAYNTQGALLAAELALPTTQIAPISSAVPEPSSVALAVTLGCAGVLRRRRSIRS